MHKNQFPLLLPLAFLILGIVVTDYCKLESQHYKLIFALFVIVLLFGLLKLRKSFLNSFLFCSFFCMLGFTSFLTHSNVESKRQFYNQSGSTLTIQIDEIYPTTNSNRIVANVKSVNNAESKKVVSGKLIIYVRNTTSLQLKASYLVPYNIQKIEQYQNPGGFNYGKFLSRQNIYYQSFLKNEDFQIEDPAPPFHNQISRLRTGMITFFKTKITNQSDFEVVISILLGQKKELSAQNKQLFTENGLAHLLAISGMHVGIILVILNFFFIGLKNPMLRNTLILTGIWSYIIITGNQIPAIRAGFMLSIYLFGHLIRRNCKPLNSIFFAALVLLCVNPNLLFQVSFQLSFAAMISIMLFFPLIRKVFDLENKLLSLCWDLISLNLSVQILVLPLTLYYFHQLPVYSILNSIISMPFVLAIMWLGIICLLFSWVDYLSELLILVLQHILNFYSDLLSYLSNLPYSLIREIEFDAWHLLTWLVSVFLFYLLYSSKRRSLTLILTSFIPIVAFSSMHNILSNSHQRITIYDLPNQLVIDCANDNSVIRLMEVIDDPKLAFYVRDAKENIGIIQRIQVGSHKNQSFQFKGKLIAVLNEYESNFNGHKIDVCVVNKPAAFKSNLTNCESIVIPRNLNLSHISNQEKQFSQVKQKPYFIATSGAYNLKF